MYSYSAEGLAPWVARAAELAKREDVREVEVVFNNHYRGQAVADAEMFREMISSGGVGSSNPGQAPSSLLALYDAR